MTNPDYPEPFGPDDLGVFRRAAEENRRRADESVDGRDFLSPLGIGPRCFILLDPDGTKPVPAQELVDGWAFNNKRVEGVSLSGNQLTARFSNGWPDETYTVVGGRSRVRSLRKKHDRPTH